MRLAPFISILTATAVLAISMEPSVHHSDAVFTATVISTQEVKIIEEDHEGIDTKFRWELWRAEVKIKATIKQDTNLAERVTVYFPQDHTVQPGEPGERADGREMLGYYQSCPGRPVIVTNRVYRFFCIRKDVGNEKGVLFVPEAGWAVQE